MIRAFGWTVAGGSTSLFLAAVRLTDQITVGSLIIAIVVGAAGIWTGVISRRRREDLQAAASAWKDERDAEKAKADRLETEAAEKEARIIELEKNLAVAIARTDITRVEEMINDQFREAVVERDLQHKERLAIIEQVAAHTTHSVDVLQGVRQSLDALTQSILHIVDKGSNNTTEGSTA